MKTPKLRVTGLFVGNSPDTGEFPAQMASNAKKSPFDDVIMYYDVHRCVQGIGISRLILFIHSK